MFTFYKVLTSDKDRIGLLRYRDSINDHNEIEYINNVLRVSVSILLSIFE